MPVGSYTNLENLVKSQVRDMVGHYQQEQQKVVGDIRQRLSDGDQMKSAFFG